MVAPIVRDHGLLALADDVQLLIVPQAKPGPGKAECRPWNGRQAEHIAIERGRTLDIRDMNGNVVELGDLQGRSEW